MNVLSNRDSFGYNTMLKMEEHSRKEKRKIVWVGAQRRLANKWFWVDYNTPEWPWSGHEVEDQPWGLREPDGSNICVVADSVLKWKWNSMSCIVSGHVICESGMKRCPRPEGHEGSFIKSGNSHQLGNVEVVYRVFLRAR